MTGDEVERFARALRRLSPRASQALGLRLLEGRTPEACARFFGITREAFDLLLWRAATELRAFVDDPQRRAPPAPERLSFEAERAQAQSLARTLAGAEAADPASAAVLQLAGIAGPVKQRLAALERDYELSPAGRREVWIRWLVIAAAVGLTGYLYLRQKEPDPPDRHSSTAQEAGRPLGTRIILAPERIDHAHASPRPSHHPRRLALRPRLSQADLPGSRRDARRADGPVRRADGRAEEPHARQGAGVRRVALDGEPGV